MKERIDRNERNEKKNTNEINERTNEMKGRETKGSNERSGSLCICMSSFD